MHEMSLAEGVLQLVEDTARREAASRVKTVVLEIGQMSSVEPEALRFCFESVTRGSIAQGATLEIVCVPGAGRLPTAAPTGFRTFWGNDAVMKGLCSLEGIVVEPLPPGFTKVRGDVLARHDALLRSPPSDDAAGWRAALACIEEAWLAPALAAVNSSVLRRLTLVACGHARGVHVTIGRGDLWRFWRKPVALAGLAP